MARFHWSHDRHMRGSDPLSPLPAPARGRPNRGFRDGDRDRSQRLRHTGPPIAGNTQATPQETPAASAESAPTPREPLLTSEVSRVWWFRPWSWSLAGVAGFVVACLGFEGA